MHIRSLLFCIAAIAPALPAQSAFITMAKGDTLLIERFTRTPTRLDGDVTPKGSVRMVYSNPIDASGRLGNATFTVYSPGAAANAPPMQTASVMIQEDSAIATMTAGITPPRVQRLASMRNAQPVLNTSMASFEVIIAAARRTHADTATMPVFLLLGGQTYPAVFSGLNSDSVSASIAKQSSWFVTDKDGRVIRGGIPSQSVTFSRVDGIGVSKLGAKPDYSAPAGAPYSAESVTVPTTMGHTLGGTLTKPTVTTASGKFPVVISITGSGAQDRDEYISVVPKGYRLFRQIADTLGKRGIAMLRLDDRGYGASGGDFASATSRDFANDVRAAIAYLRTRADVDARRIFLAGHSEGGLVAPMVAVDEPTLAGIVLMAGPARTGREILNFQIRYGIEHDTAIATPKRDSMLAHVSFTVDSALNSSPWLKFFGSYDPIATARRVKVPVLILQGGDDQQVIATEARTLESTFKSAGNRDVTLRVFPDLNHLFIYQPGGNPSGYTSLTSNLAVPESIGALAEWVHTHSTVMR
jgi:uncharacterized protein